MVGGPRNYLAPRARACIYTRPRPNKKATLGVEPREPKNRPASSVIEGRRGFEGRVAKRVPSRGPQRFRRSGCQEGAEPRAAEVSKVGLPKRCRAAAKAAVARKAEARSTRVELPMRVKVEKKRPPRDKIFPKKFCRQCPQTQTNELASPPSPTGWPIPTFWRCSSNHSTTFSS